MNDIVAEAVVRQALADGTAVDVREKAGVSRAAVARAIGVDESAVWRWEHGARRPRPAAAQRYAEVLRALFEATQR